MAGNNDVRIAVRRIASWLRHTPFHPQWLLGSRARQACCIAGLARGRVLDIGCADRWIEDSLPAECEYIGIDYPMTGGELYKARPDVFADASCLPVADGTIDTVVMLEVLEHLRRPREAIHEIGRVLRPGGQVLLTMPFLYPMHDAPHDYQRFTAHGIVREFEAASLCIEVLKPSLGSAETSGLLACLALAGMALESIEKRRLSMMLAPLVAIVIPVVNIGAWLCARMLPPWGALTAGYWVQARKP